MQSKIGKWVKRKQEIIYEKNIPNNSQNSCMINEKDLQYFIFNYDSAVSKNIFVEVPIPDGYPPLTRRNAKYNLNEKFPQYVNNTFLISYIKKLKGFNNVNLRKIKYFFVKLLI